MSALSDVLAGSVMSWMPQLMLLCLLVNQPWRMYMPAGSLAELLGRISTVLATIGLLLPDLGTTPEFWAALTVSHLSWVITAYFAADNHHFLMGYWCLTITLALSVGESDGEQLMARAATLLIGLCFAVAVVAKLVSRVYRDGSFFVWELVSDSRFLPLATFVGGLTPELRQQHATARVRVQSGESHRETAPVPAELRWLALSLTWWTIAIETAIALLFLAPASAIGTLEWTRAAALATFALTTFTFVAVPAFGEILLLMLLAATNDLTLRWYIVVLALWLVVVTFIPHLANRLTLPLHKTKTAQAHPTAVAQGS